MVAVPSLVATELYNVPFPVVVVSIKANLVTSGLSVNGRTEFTKLFLDCSRCLAGQCRYNGCFGSSICLLRSLLLAAAHLIAAGAIPAVLCSLIEYSLSL